LDLSGPEHGPMTFLCIGGDEPSGYTIEFLEERDI